VTNGPETYSYRLRQIEEHIRALEVEIKASRSGDWSRAQRLAIEEVIHEYVSDSTGASWSGRERLMAILAGLIGVASFALTVVVTAHGW
jgi:hypothetical protein